MRTFWLFPILVVLIVAVNAAIGIEIRPEFSLAAYAGTWRIVDWGLTVVLLIGCFAVVGLLPTGNPPVSDWRGVLIDQRNKITLSRFQLVLWSLLVIATIIVEGMLNAIWGVKNPLGLAVPPQLWVLLGLSSGSAVAAPIVLGMKPIQNLDTKGAKQHAWSDMFYGDETGNADQVDFSKIQQFFLTVVLVVAYATGIIMILLSPGTPPGVTDADKMTYFPALDNGLLALMGVSQVAYIAYKAVPQTKLDSKKPAGNGGAGDAGGNGGGGGGGDGDTVQGGGGADTVQGGGT